MPRGTSLSRDQQVEILSLSREGRSQSYIAKAVDRSRHCVANFLQHPDGYGSTKRSGRRSKVSNMLHRRLIRHARTGRYTCGELAERLDLPVGIRRVRQLLNESGKVKYTKRLAAPLMTPEHKKNRVRWALEAQSWAEKFDSIVWSDEKKFNLDGPDGYNYYWADTSLPREHYSKRQNGGGGVMVWGGFSSAGKTAVAFLEGKQDSSKYIYTLSEYLLPFAHRVHGTDWHFQQDNASIHTARQVKAWFEEPEIEISCIEWPAKSPDLNPIENLWGFMAKRVYDKGRRKFSNKTELVACIQAVWDEITITELQNLVNSMPDRCRLVIESKGGKIPY